MRKSAPLFCALLLSLSARRAWIEMKSRRCVKRFQAVALRKESVDRNLYLSSFVLASLVALRKESVDRNNVIRPAIDVFLASLSARRAWIEMTFSDGVVSGSGESLSARRAWIEMHKYHTAERERAVALRKESVDRNCEGGVSFEKNHNVALRKESVDRNMLCLLFRPVVGCRSPQGERG